MPLEIPAGVPRTCDLPSFDTTLGKLESVKVDVTLLIQDGRFRAENLDPDNACPGNSAPDAWSINVTAAAFEPSSAVPACQKFGSCSGSIPVLPRFDGVIDFGVPGGGDCASTVCQVGSGRTQNCPDPPPLTCSSVCIMEPARLAAYDTSGSGQVQFTLQSVGNNAVTTGCGKVITALRMRVGVTFTVTYNYYASLVGTTFCFGDGSLTTPCPCTPPNVVPNPSGAPDAGCANSLSLAGARLLGVGTLAPDTLQFVCAIGLNYSGFAFLVKGDGTNAAGIVNGDGVRCVDGTLVRFGAHNASRGGAGCWSYPNTAQTTSISAATAQPAGQSASYQLVYRNAEAGFCSPATTNVSSGVLINWP